MTAFNAPQLGREIGNPLCEPAAMRQACEVLADAGPIRARFERRGSTGGRLAQSYEVNPALFGGEP